MSNSQINNIRIEILKNFQINHICNAYTYIKIIYLTLLPEMILRSLCKWCRLYNWPYITQTSFEPKLKYLAKQANVLLVHPPQAASTNGISTPSSKTGSTGSFFRLLQVLQFRFKHQNLCLPHVNIDFFIPLAFMSQSLTSVHIQHLHCSPAPVDSPCGTPWIKPLAQW